MSKPPLTPTLSPQAGRGGRKSQSAITKAASVFVLPDVLAPGLRVVFCGTAAGTESARQQAYYAHPHNRFWRALHEAGFTPRRLAPAEYWQVLDYGLGLTDIAKFDSGLDKALPKGALGRDPCAALRAKIALHAPRHLAFTSLTAARQFLRRPRIAPGLQEERVGETAIWALTSPSPLAQWNWDLAPWAALAEAAR